MGTTGVIFGAIAIAWLAYLVPHFVRRREGEWVADEADPLTRFSETARVVRHGTARLLDQDLTPIGQYEVSTPLTRRAAIRELRRLDQVAASRRRRVLLVLLVLLSAAIGVSAAGLVGWWLVAIPAVLLFAFLAVARVSVRAMRRDLDGRFAQLREGNSETTVRLSRAEVAAASSAVASATSLTAPSAVPGAASGALWDPVPITVPTYVSKPLAPRTVRTIDLSGPGVATSSRQGDPVTADAPAASTTPSSSTSSAGEDEGREAVAG